MLFSILKHLSFCFFHAILTYHAVPFCYFFQTALLNVFFTSSISAVARNVTHYRHPLTLSAPAMISLVQYFQQLTSVSLCLLNTVSLVIVPTSNITEAQCFLHLYICLLCYLERVLIIKTRVSVILNQILLLRSSTFFLYGFRCSHFVHPKNLITLSIHLFIFPSASL